MRNTELSVTKSMLAKLLAGENITVVHQKGIKTASFDLKSRTLYLPVYENMDGPMYDLIVGHEDGHALYTPEEGWHSAIVDPSMLTDKQKQKKVKFNKGFKDVLNVVEDARIEKLIKRKYPGIARSFTLGYAEFHKRDFFGISKLKSLSQLNIVDRINLNAKIGTLVIVPFNDEERELVREVEKLETWEQVVDLSVRIYARAIQERDEYINSMEDLTEQLLKEFDNSAMSEEDMEDMLSDSGEDEGEEEEQKDGSFKPFDPDAEPEKTEESKGEGEGTDAEATEEEADDSESTGTSDKEGEEEESDESGKGDAESDDSEDDEDASGETSDSGDSDKGGDGEDDLEQDEDADITSVTDRNFREREKELILENTEVFTYSLPQPDLSKIVVPVKVVVENFHEILNAAIKSSGDKVVSTCVKAFNEHNMRYVNLLVKEFEMRKNAAQYARTTQTKTGELDMSKLHLYKFSNNLFRKVNVVPKGKNHGLIMYVDMSGSMNRMFGPTMEQTLILVSFCRKVGIPFEVYGFSDNSAYLSHMVSKKKLPQTFLNASGKFRSLPSDRYTINRENGFHLVHMISSTLSGNSYKRAFEMMAVVAMNYNHQKFPNTRFSFSTAGFGLNYTPFIQTLLASRPMIEQFKTQRMVDIVNVIYLTDGAPSDGIRFDEAKYGTKQKVYLVDPITKERIDMGGYETSQMAKLASFVRRVTGCKHIGFYIADTKTVKRNMASATYRFDQKEKNAVEHTYREHDYFSVPVHGYDMYYYVKSQYVNVEDDDYEFTEKMTTRKMASTFIKAQESKQKNRVLISRFIEDIATVGSGNHSLHSRRCW